MGKRLLVFLLALTICMAASTVVLADDVDVLRIAVNGETIEMPAKVIDGELFLPLRAVSEKLGFEVLWFGKNQEIIIRMPERNINIRPSDYIIAVDDHESYIQGGYTHVGGRTYMRQDFFSDNMGLKIIWDKAKNDVRIHSVKENPIVINTKKEVKETQTLKLTIQYPEIKGLDNTEVQHKLNSLFSKLAAEAKKEGYEFAKYIGQDEIARGIKVETYFNYQVKYNQNGMLSIVFSAYLYSGGAHGNTLQSSYTFDLNTGEECDLKDLFKDGIDYVSYISDEVKKQMEEKGMTDALLNPFDAIKADQDFYLSNNAVVVYFQAYEYFPYVFGIPEFDIPLLTLNDMLKPEFSFLIMDGIVSENTLDYDKDSKNEKIVVRMVDGKQYEETEAGPFQGWNWQGKFVVSLIDEAGKTISELDLNEAFGGQDLVFNSSFLLQFDDYNNDGNLDFALGQYASSNGNVYRLFTIKDDVIELLPVKTGEIFSSGGRSRYTTEFEKFAKSGFINTYYDNIKGKYIEQHFVWDGSQFIIKSTFEKDVAVSAH